MTKPLEYALRQRAWPVDGFSVWDGVGAVTPLNRAAVRCLRDPDLIPETVRSIHAGPIHRPLVTYDGVTIGKYPFGWNS